MCKNKKFNLLVLIPNSGMSTMTLADRKQMLSKYADNNTEISVECIPAGPISIETEHEEFEAGIHILNRARTAAEDGFDCMIVYCSSDPAVRAARELAKIPGSARRSLHRNGNSGRRFRRRCSMCSRAYRRMALRRGNIGGK